MRRIVMMVIMFMQVNQLVISSSDNGDDKGLLIYKALKHAGKKVQSVGLVNNYNNKLVCLRYDQLDAVRDIIDSLQETVLEMESVNFGTESGLLERLKKQSKNSDHIDEIDVVIHNYNRTFCIVEHILTSQYRYRKAIIPGRSLVKR